MGATAEGIFWSKRTGIIEMPLCKSYHQEFEDNIYEEDNNSNSFAKIASVLSTKENYILFWDAEMMSPYFQIRVDNKLLKVDLHNDKEEDINEAFIVIRKMADAIHSKLQLIQGRL